MKPKHIQTKLSHQQKRNQGDEPDLGRVARIPGASKRLEKGVRKRSRSRRRSSSEPTDRRRIRHLKARKFVITFWLSIILFGCLATVTTVTVMWLRAQDDRRNIVPLFTPPDIGPALQITDFPVPSEREALTIMQGALQAADAETLGNFVHESHEVSTAEMLAFFAATQERDGNLTSHQWIGSSDTDTLQIQSMVLTFNQAGKLNHRIAMLVPNASGDWLLDFPSYARWCHPPIHQMSEPGGYPGGRVRVFIRRDTYFNGPFSDDREWACFVIDSPDTEIGGYAYSHIGSPEHQFLEKLLNQSSRQPRVTLEIERVEGAQDRQFKITNVLSHDWVSIHPDLYSE